MSSVLVTASSAKIAVAPQGADSGRTPRRTGVRPLIDLRPLPPDSAFDRIVRRVSG